MFAEVYERNNGNLAIYYGPEDHTGPVTYCEVGECGHEVETALTVLALTEQCKDPESEGWPVPDDPQGAYESELGRLILDYERGGYHKFATPGYAGKALLQALDL